MRVLVFVPENVDSDFRPILKDTVKARLALANTHKLGDFDIRDAETLHQTASWGELITTARIYKAEYDVIVVGLDGRIKVGPHFQSYIRAIGQQSGLPVVAYVDGACAETAFELITANIAAVADDQQDGRTLAAMVNRTLMLRQRTENQMIIGPITLNLDTHEVYGANRELHFTRKESDLLALLAFRKGTVITKQQFLDRLYDIDDEPEIKIIDVFVSKVRSKLNKLDPDYPDLGNIIDTIWGVGYRLIDYVPPALALPAPATPQLALPPPTKKLEA